MSNSISTGNPSSNTDTLIGGVELDNCKVVFYVYLLHHLGVLPLLGEVVAFFLHCVSLFFLVRQTGPSCHRSGKLLL